MFVIGWGISDAGPVSFFVWETDSVLRRWSKSMAYTMKFSGLLAISIAQIKAVI